MVPPVALSVSQSLVLETVNGTARAVASSIANVCVPGLSPPSTAVKLKDSGSTTRTAGGSAFTVICTVSASFNSPSDASKIAVYTPASPISVTQEKDPVPSPLSSNVAPAGSCKAASDGVVPSGSVAVTVSASVSPSVTAVSGKLPITGA